TVSPGPVQPEARARSPSSLPACWDRPPTGRRAPSPPAADAPTTNRAGSFLGALDRRREPAALEALAVELGQLERADDHPRLAVEMRFEHDRHGLLGAEARHAAQQGPDDVVHRVHVVVPEDHRIWRQGLLAPAHVRPGGDVGPDAGRRAHRAPVEALTARTASATPPCGPSDESNLPQPRQHARGEDVRLDVLSGDDAPAAVRWYRAAISGGRGGAWTTSSGGSSSRWTPRATN